VIVLDASVLIAHLEADDPQHDRAEILLSDLAHEELGASPLTLAEVMVGPARAARVDRATAVLEELQVQQIALSDDAPLRLALLRAGTNLKLPDCAVLLAAETAGAAVASFDDRLCAAARERGHAVRSR
jgi:predicted nucleic acid-binding protein